MLYAVALNRKEVFVRVWRIVLSEVEVVWAATHMYLHIAKRQGNQHGEGTACSCSKLKDSHACNSWLVVWACCHSHLQHHETIFWHHNLEIEAR